MKILIVKLSSIGDIVSALPAISDAAFAYQNLQIHWLIDENLADIPSWHFAVTKIIKIPLQKNKKHLIKYFFSKNFRIFCKELRQEKYDYVIDLQGLIKTAIIARFAKAKYYCGFKFSAVREPLARLFYNKVATHIENKDKTHAISRMRELLAFILKYSFQKKKIYYGIYSNKSIVKDKYIIFLHGTSCAKKKWSLHNWTKLTSLILMQLPYIKKIKVFYHNDEELYIVQQLQKKYNIIEIIPPLSLTDTLPIIENATAIIGVDTGFSHIASAVCSNPIITLYATTFAHLCGGIGKYQIHLIADKPEIIKARNKNLKKNKSNTNVDINQMSAIDANSVIEALRLLFDKIKFKL